MYAALGFILAALPAAFAVTHDVTVGAGGLLAYDPPYISANPGDVVNFIFHPKNHTVTQSAFDPPCVPLPEGFDSGFVPVASDSDLVSYPVFVPDASPIWVHCEQTGHCGKGMVFAINPPADPNPHSFSAFKALAIKQNGTATATTTTAASVASATSTPVDHKITVGANGLLAYSSPNITAAIGDTVTFEFHPKNHTVTQSSFAQPCLPLAATSTAGQVGFNSGFMPVSANATVFPTFQIKVNSTAPIWGFCGQTGHCGSGMVFSINAVESDPAHNFDAFQALAKKINGTAAMSMPAPAATGYAGSLLGSVNAATVDGSDTDSKVKLYGTVAIVLLAINVVVGLVLLFLGALMYIRRGASPRNGVMRSVDARYVPVKFAESAPRASTAEDRPYAESY